MADLDIVVSLSNHPSCDVYVCVCACVCACVYMCGVCESMHVCVLPCVRQIVCGIIINYCTYNEIK